MMATSRSLRVGVLFGGRSSEHAVSLSSAANVMEALCQAGHTVRPIGITAEGLWLTDGDPFSRLTSAGPVRLNGEDDGRAAAPHSWALLPHASGRERLPDIDIVFPVLHGPYGEDGTVQGLLEMANLPYVGCGVLASAAAMDKDVVRGLFAQGGLRQVAYRTLLRGAWRRESETALSELEEALGYPVFVKPANLGSSIGISKAKGRAELRAAIDLAARYDRKIVVEAAVPQAREIEVSVLGNDEPVASVPGEIIPGREFYDYRAKYLEETSRLLIPAPLDPALTAEAQATALAAFRAIDGAGLARVDFLLDGESGVLYLNEINTMPGFTRISMYPKLWAASGIGYPELVDRLLELGLERYADRQQNATDYDPDEEH